MRSLSQLQTSGICAGAGSWRRSGSPARNDRGRRSTSLPRCSEGRPQAGLSITRTRAPRHFPYIRRVRFSVGADEYDRFIGRYSVPLAPRFAEFAGVAAGQRVLDVGCGPGALTVELVRRLGAEAVRAVDPSENFVAAVRARHPGVEVQRAAAEQLPFDDELFDAALAQLVVHFMADPLAGLREMARVTTAGGVVAGCVWDHAGGQGPLSLFWKAARQLDRRAPFRSTSTIRRSRSGGSRSCSASGPQAATWRASIPAGRLACASSVRRCCRRPRSSSRHARGQPAGAPRNVGVVFLMRSVTIVVR